MEILKNFIKNLLLSSDKLFPALPIPILSTMIRSILTLETELRPFSRKLSVQEAILILWVSIPLEKMSPSSLPNQTKFQLHMLMKLSSLKEHLKEFMFFSILSSQESKMPSWYLFLNILFTLLQLLFMEDLLLHTTWIKLVDGSWIWNKWRDLWRNRRGKEKMWRL